MSAERSPHSDPDFTLLRGFIAGHVKRDHAEAALRSVQEQVDDLRADLHAEERDHRACREQKQRLVEQLESLQAKLTEVAGIALSYDLAPFERKIVQEALNPAISPEKTNDPEGPLASDNPTSGEGSEFRRRNDDTTPTGAHVPADSPNGEQTREQLLERLARTVEAAIASGGFAGTLFESQVIGTLWLLYGERSPASEPWLECDAHCTGSCPKCAGQSPASRREV